MSPTGARPADDFQTADYPPPGGPRLLGAGRWVAMGAVGTGFVWASVGQGSGELIFWPYLVARYGLHFAGWILPACLLQYWVNFEIARYTVATGETILAGFWRISRRLTWLLGLLMAPSLVWFGAYASAGGTALAALTGFPAGWSPRGQSLFWAYAAIGLFVSFVFFRIVYRALERFMIAVALVALAGVAAACAHPAVAAGMRDFLGAYFSLQPRLPPDWQPQDAQLLITAVTFAGMGGFFNLFYSYWLRDRGVGMAGATGPDGRRLVGRVTSPLRGASETIPSAGFRPPDTEASRRALRLWLRGVSLDNAVGVGLNLVTVSLLGLLAFVTLYPAGLVPDGWQIAVVQARFFEVAWGPAGGILFLSVAALFLADTWPGVLDGVARLSADFVGLVRGSRGRTDYRALYWRIAAGLAVVTLLTLPLAPPSTLLLLQGVLNFFAMVLYCPMLVWLNWLHLPRVAPAWTRPGWISMAGITAASATYLFFFLWYLGTLL